MKKTIALLLGLVVLLQLQACAGLVVAGGATAALVAHDRRTAGTVLEDQNIEFKANDALYSDKNIKEKTHINTTSYNQVLLLTGEAPTPELRQRAEDLVRDVPKVRQLYNEIIVAEPNSFGTRTSDSWLSTKVKSNLFQIKDIKGFDPTRVKVVSANGTVFLLGLLTQQEADAVVEVARHVNGVQRVVKLFEYVEPQAKRE